MENQLQLNVKNEYWVIRKRYAKLVGKEDIWEEITKKI